MDVSKFFKLDSDILSVTVEGRFDRDLALLVQDKLDEYKVQRIYRDAKIVEIYEGTKEIEKIIVANSILG